jgi:hypothetical protein
MLEDLITLDGRKFRGDAQSLSASQDDYIIARLRQCGAMDILTDNDGGPSRTKEQKAEDLLTRILLSGKTAEILAGCLTEEGTKWTRSEADRNAAIFSEITDTAEKLTMRQSVTMFVAGFFTFGERASESSPKSSNPTGKAHRSGNAAGATSGTSAR